MAGKPVKTIDIPAGEAVDLDWGPSSGVKLQDFRSNIKAGQTWFDVTLTRAKNPSHHHDRHDRSTGKPGPGRDVAGDRMPWMNAQPADQHLVLLPGTGSIDIAFSPASRYVHLSSIRQT